jgi:hypothetical protein
MNATGAFVEFVTRILVPAKASRFAALASTTKGHRKILEGLCHDFDAAIRSEAIRERNYDKLWDQPSFVFHSPRGFGVEFSNFRDAYEQMSVDDSWLILLQDASAGIYRPEARWDDEKLIVG